MKVARLVGVSVDYLVALMADYLVALWDKTRAEWSADYLAYCLVVATVAVMAVSTCQQEKTMNE